MPWARRFVADASGGADPERLARLPAGQPEVNAALATRGVDGTGVARLLVDAIELDVASRLPPGAAAQAPAAPVRARGLPCYRPPVQWPSPQALVRASEALAWAAFLVCLRQLFALFEVGRLSPALLFNVDTLFPADLCLDLAQGGRLADWSFPHVVPFFPDGLLWLVAWAAAPTVQTAVLAFGALQVLLVTGVARWVLVRELGPGAGAVAPAAFATVFAFMARGELAGAVDLLRPVHHFSVLLVALPACLLAAEWLERPRRGPLLALAALLFLGCVSDPFVLTCAAAPTIALFALVAVRDRSRLGAMGQAGVLLVGAAALGTAIARALTAVGQDLGTLKTVGLAAQWQTLGRALGTLGPSAPDVLGALALLLLPVLFVRGVLALRRPSLGAVLDVTPLLAVVANQAALLVTGNVVGELLNRYQVVVFGLLVLVLARAGAGLLPRAPLRASAALALTLGCAGFLTSKVQGPPRTSLRTWTPPGMACIERETAERGARRGLADVPTARPYTLLNGSGLRLEQLELGLPRWWLSTRRHFAVAEPPWSFALFSGAGAAEQARAMLTDHSELVLCPGTALIFWDAAARADVTRQVTGATPR